MNHTEIHSFTHAIFADDLHAKRVASLVNAVEGVMESASLAIHAIGRGLAAVHGLTQKHAIKQIDRLISNDGLDVDGLFPAWVLHVIGPASHVTVNLDWTDFDDDDHTMLVLALQTSRGRSAPLMWKTVLKSKLKNQRNAHEDALVERFREIVPPSVRVTLVADRGFADTAFFTHLASLDFAYVIRFRSNFYVTSQEGVKRKAREWPTSDGRGRLLKGARLTEEGVPVTTVLIIRDPDMQEPWCIASSLDANAQDLKHLYQKRFSIEEMFRDVKDLRFGMGMKWTHIKAPARRDRLFLLAALAQALLTLLGEAGESIGMDKDLKANTVKKRTLSLLRQGIIWYDALPNMKETRLRPLMQRFGELLRASKLHGHVLALSVVEK